jgi:TolB-like protein/Tfp pilus assembly protein PilF
MQNASSSSQIIRFSTFELDVHAGELRKQGVKIKLQEQPFQILAMLLEHPGQLVTREELRGRLWPSDTFVDFDHGLNKAINKLREALGDSAENPRLIETLAKRGYRFLAEQTAQTDAIRSLLVLPLENLSSDPEQEYFADGLTEALITILAKISALRVISRTTAMSYKGTRKPLPDIARELNVEGIVEGTVLRSEGRVRISAQLLHAPSDTHLWAETFDRDLRDILALQAEVSRAIAAEIKTKLSPQEQGQLKQSRPVVPEAYEAYLMGRHYWNKRTPEGLRKGAEYFQQSIEKDPTYAAAYAGLADMAASAGFWGFLPPAQASLKAQAAARKSLAIEENGEAHSALGWAIFLHDYDYPASTREFQRAIALYPGFAPAYQWYGHCLICSGRLQEGLELNRQALRLDPLSLIAHVCYAGGVWFAREWDRCIDDCRRALEIDPNYMGLHWMQANALQSKGDHEQAIRARQRALEVAPEAVICLAELANSYAAAGIRSEALKLLEQLHELRGQKYVMAYWMAGIYCSLKDKEEAFQWLDRALEERSSQLAYVNVDPRFDSLRPDPRFHDLLRRMKPEQ